MTWENDKIDKHSNQRDIGRVWKKMGNILCKIEIAHRITVLSTIELGVYDSQQFTTIRKK